MRRKLPALVSSVLFVLSLALSARGAVPVQSVDSRSSSQTSVLESKLQQWVNHELQVYHWKADAVDITPISVNADPSEVTALFDVKITHRLAYSTPDEVPALKGRKAFLEHAATLNSRERAWAEEEIRQWETTLQRYIDTPLEGWETFKVTAALGPDGRVLPGSIEIYSEQPVGRFVRAEDVLKTVPTPAEAEVYARQAIAEKVKLLEGMVSTRTSPASVTSTSSVTSTYNRLNATNYANLWVANTDLPCQSGSSTVQDKSNYNPNYSAYTCNDCANYASQVMYTGGIPQDSTWYKDSPVWYNVGNMRTYFTQAGSGHYHWAAAATLYSLAEGDMIVMWDYDKYGQIEYTHVMIVVYDDGTYAQYSAHSSDRNMHGVSPSSSFLYYIVQ